MKLDAWMPFYGADFMSATMMLPKAIKWTYLSCLWHYWAHTKCTGIVNDDETMRELCQCDQSEWSRVKALVFDNDRYFKLEDGKWHQKRAKELFTESLSNSQKRSTAGSKGAATRWQKHSKPDGKTDATGEANGCHPEPESESSCVCPDASIPTLTEVKAEAAMRGLRAEVAQELFDYYQGNSLWLNKHGQLIDWRYKLLVWSNDKRQNGKSYEHRNNRGQGNDRNSGKIESGQNVTADAIAKGKIR